MQRLIKVWGKEDVVNIGQRAILYKTIKRLRDAGLIAVRQTERSRQYPERTVYELTADGLAVGEQWLVDMLRNPRNEYPEFPAALSFAMGLSPNALADLLAERLVVITAQLEELDAEVGAESPMIPRIVLIESEYKRALVRAEMNWLSSTIDELRSGSFQWDSTELIAQAQTIVAKLIDL
jgi:DNA-binding PadR family transcriptional regulator